MVEWNVCVKMEDIYHGDDDDDDDDDDELFLWYG